MTFTDVLKNMFRRKEPEVYTPQREYVDKRHDGLQRQISYYEKKRQIPIMEARIKRYEKEVYGNGFKTKDEHNILKVPNYFKAEKKQYRRGEM